MTNTERFLRLWVFAVATVVAGYFVASRMWWTDIAILVVCFVLLLLSAIAIQRAGGEP